MLKESGKKNVISEPCQNRHCDRDWLYLVTERSMVFFGTEEPLPDLKLCDQCHWQAEMGL